MTIRFCFFCGSGYNQETKWLSFECTVCSAVFIAPTIVRETQVTLEEAQAAFDKIPLTDKKAINAAKRKITSLKRK
jgi:hypothetical protein